MNAIAERCAARDAGSGARARKRGRSVRALLALCTAAAVVFFAAPAERAAAQSDPDTTPVQFPDANLRAKMESRLGKTSGQTITRADMATTNLGCCLQHARWNAHLHPPPSAPTTVIGDLTGLEYLTQSFAVNLSYHQITDLSPLSGLTNTRRLWLSYNRITDLSPLSGLTLDHLSVSHNPITDLSPLSNQVWLATFYAVNTGISDLSPLSGLTRIRILDLQENNIRDISPLTRVNDLSEVYLSGNLISDLSPLANRNLKTLTADHNRITDLSPLRNSLSMEVLNLNGNEELSDLSVVERMTALKVLRLDGTGVRDLSPLVRNTGLGSGDQVYLRNVGRSLNDDAAQHVATLRGRGVSVYTSSPLRWSKAVRDVAVAPGVTSLTVSWTPVTATTAYTARGYRVYWWSGDQGRSSRYTPPQHQDVSADTSRSPILGLTPGVEYKVQILPYPPIGDFSAVVPGTPLADLSMGEVTVAAGVTSLVVSWDRVTGAADYKVQWKSGEQGYDRLARQALADGANEVTIPDLEAGVEHTVRVFATTADGAEGPPSAGATGTPLADLSMGELTVEPDVESLVVSWDRVTGAADYKVQWKSGEQGYDPVDRQELADGANEVTILELDAGVEYTVRVIATTDDGAEGPPSTATGTPQPVAVATLPPELIMGEVMVAAGVESLVVSWDPVDGADGYKVQWKSREQDYDPVDRQALAGGGGETRVTVTIPDLDAGVLHTVRVFATTDDGAESLPSDEVSGTPRPVAVGTLPAELIMGDVTVAAGTTSLVVSWDPVDGADGYKVQWKSGEQDYDPDARQMPARADETRVTISGLTAGVEHTVRVFATTDDGAEGPPSTETGTPWAALIMGEVTVEAGVTSLVVSWDRVAGAAGYKVQWKRGEQDYDPDARQMPARADGTRVTISGLTAGVEYTVRVIATTAGEIEGPPSTEETGTPWAALIMGEVTVAAGTTSLVVSWDRVDGAAGYKVQWKSGEQDYDPDARQMPARADETRVTISGLTAGVEYTVRVIATTAGEIEGPPSTEETGTPYLRNAVVTIMGGKGIVAPTVVEGADAELLVMLDRPSEVRVTVVWTTEDDTAKAEEDYRAMRNRYLTFRPGEVQKKLRVPTLEDRRVEPEETFRVRLIPTGTTHADPDPAAASVKVTITDDDTEPVRRRALDKVLAGTGRWIAADAVEVIEERFTGREVVETQLGLGGRTLSLPGIGSREPAGSAAPGTRFARDGLDPGHPSNPARADEWTPRESASHPALSSESLTRSRFNLPLGQQDAGAAEGGLPGLRIWGRGSAGGFDGRPEAGFRMDGEVVGGYLGVDYRPRRDALVGVALVRNWGDVDYVIDDVTTGAVDLELTSLLPYAHWNPRGDLEMWGLLGAGSGNAELEDEAGEVETDLEMRMAAFGLRQEVAVWREVAVALKTDAFLAELKTDAKAGLPKAGGEAGRLRLRLEGRMQRATSPVSRLTPSLEIGGRWDGGDAETGMGLEVGGGLAYAHDTLGLEVEARGRYLLAHRESFDEWGGSLEARLDPGRAGRGPWMTFAPGWGAEGSRVAQMWDGKEVFRAHGGDEGPELSPDRLDLEVGYGAWRRVGGMGLVTPWAGLSTAGSADTHYKLGARMKAGSWMSLDLENRLSKATGYRIMLHGRLDW